MADTRRTRMGALNAALKLPSGSLGAALLPAALDTGGVPVPPAGYAFVTANNGAARVTANSGSSLVIAKV